MRNLTLICTASIALAVGVAGACGSSTETNEGTGTGAGTGTGTGTATSTWTGSNGGGGAGGGTGTVTGTQTNSGGANTGTATATVSNCGGGSPCETACCKLTHDCGFPITCADINPYINNALDCGNNPAADCNGLCVIDASCSDISTLISPQPNQDLMDCLTNCGGVGGGGGGDACTSCMYGSCSGALVDCYNDPQGKCMDFLSCVNTQDCQDWACLQTCLTANDSPAGQAVVTCTCGACDTSCAFCTATGTGTSTGVGGAGIGGIGGMGGAGGVIPAGGTGVGGVGGT